MATKKTLTCVAFLGLALLGVLLTGCKPAGVKALYAGEKHLRDGEFQQAVEVLEEAVSLMPTNALAYNYLGLAYHRNGQAREAHVAYSRALTLDKELAVVRYNLDVCSSSRTTPSRRSMSLPVTPCAFRNRFRAG